MKPLVATISSLAAIALAALLPAATGCGGDDANFEVALAADSPWPKFRCDARQTGTSPVIPTGGGMLWEFPTGKGIFSTPVVGGDGTIYVGSADRSFYAINRDGTLRWSFETGEIIDSSALLDDEGRVIFGSGDSHLYALDAATGNELWNFQADDPEVNDAFIRWFEGNVAIGRNGDLYVPNDNFFIYSIDRQDGALNWRFKMPDQTWSLPAVDPNAERIYIGNNNVIPAFGDNLFAIGNDGSEIWSASIVGTIAASPLLSSDMKIVVGGFDGYLRSYDEEHGLLEWSFGVRDHIYASPAELADGTLVQPAADGTVYGIDPTSGEQLWAFDAREPIRSSPAIDGDGNIYFGSGEGRLFVLDSAGTLRWAIQLVDDDRNDLNSSPALGSDAIYLAGENGTIFSVPYDYCLDAGSGDPRCLVGPAEDLPNDGVMLYFTTPFGSPIDTPPTAIDANQPMAFSLFVRGGGDTELALIDSASLAVTVTPDAAVEAKVSGDRKFLTVVPTTVFTADGNGKVTLRIEGDYLQGFDRMGLQFIGGSKAGSFDQTFTFDLSPAGPATLPLPIASAGGPAGAWELYRMAAPLPTILPSYNQIGFDSLHYLIGVVEQDLAWVVGASPVEGEDRAAVDPATGVLFPMEMSYADGIVTMTNNAGFSLEVMAFALELDRFRVAARLDETGAAPAGARITVSAICDDIPMYGAFVRELGFCNPQTDVLNVFGGALLRPHDGGSVPKPSGLGTITFGYTGGIVTATLTGSTVKADDHVYVVLLVDDDTGKPVRRDYGERTFVATDDQGNVNEVAIAVGDTPPSRLRAYLMVDTYPAARVILPTTE